MSDLYTLQACKVSYLKQNWQTSRSYLNMTNGLCKSKDAYGRQIKQHARMSPPLPKKL